MRAVGLDAQVHGIRQTRQDARPVLQDKVERKIGKRGLLNGLPNAVNRLRKRFIALQLVGPEGNQSGKPGAGRRPRTQGIVVVAVQMNVAVDEAGQHEFAAGVDVVVRRRQIGFRPDGDYLFTGNSD